MSETTISTAPTSNRRLTTFLHAVMFVAGFSLVFVVGWGGVTTALGALFYDYKFLLAKIGGEEHAHERRGIGATLGAILTLGASQETAGQAMLLSSGYALGLGAPFLILGLGLGQATAFVRRFRRHLQTMEIITGAFLILMGVLMLTDSLTFIAIWAQRTGLYLDLAPGSAAVPSYFVAIVGGLLSFFSPCVLPLVPAYLSYLGGQVIGGAGVEQAGPL